MNVFDNPAFVKCIAISAAGVAAGLLLSFGVGVVRMVRRRRREGVAVPASELLLAAALAATPLTKVPYAFVAVMSPALRNLAEPGLSAVAVAVGGVFAMVAVVQGALAIRLINFPTANAGMFGTFRFKLATLGLVENLAIFALVGAMIVSARLSS